MLVALWMMQVAATSAPLPPQPPTNGFGISFQDYPAGALASNATGIVTTLLKVDDSGRVIDCAVTETSGSQALDSGTCALLKRKARFSAAMMNGRPVASDYRTALSWGVDEHQPRLTMEASLPVAHLPAGYVGPTKLKVEFDASGKAAECLVMSSSGSEAADATACRLLRSEWTIRPPITASSEPACAVRFARIAMVVSANGAKTSD